MKGSLLHRKYPQNFILKHPFWGSLILGAASFLVLIIYKPLNSHGSQNFSFSETMALYCASIALSAFLILSLTKRLSYFKKGKAWTVINELLLIVLVLFFLGIVVYFLAFAIEPQSDRWNFKTFFDSVSRTFLVGLLPFLFFSAMNLQYLKNSAFKYNTFDSGAEEPKKKISIQSKLKKEHLDFYAEDFLFAESDGNYVTFHLLINKELKTYSVRNSLNSIEFQLSDFPSFIRTHRAFIVNAKRIISKQGNTSGYVLCIDHSNAKIPVSRQKIKDFDRILASF